MDVTRTVPTTNEEGEPMDATTELQAGDDEAERDLNGNQSLMLTLSRITRNNLSAMSAHTKIPTQGTCVHTKGGTVTIFPSSVPTVDKDSSGSNNAFVT